MRTIAVTILIAFWALSVATCHAQTPQAPPHVPAFDRIFPQYTGVNGYEDLVMAGDLIYNNAALDAAQQPGATLTIRRHALADPDVQRALALLRTGLAKKIRSPRTSFDSSTLLPEYSSFRALARLLALEQYVLLADGQVDGAIQSVGDGLRLGLAARTEHILISDLVGIAIDAIAIVQIGRHLDQLSEHDCDSLSRLLDERLAAQPSPAPTLLKERDVMLQELERLRKDPRNVIKDWLPTEEEQNSPETAQMMASLAANSAVVNQAVDEAAGMLKLQFDSIIGNLQLPPWQRPDVTPPTGKTLAHELIGILSPAYNQALDKFTINRVQLTLLALHVAIRKYRWQYNHPPDRLEQVRRDDLIVDPFTGKPLGYRRLGDQYELSSEGPYDRGENGERIPGQRKPISTKR